MGECRNHGTLFKIDGSGVKIYERELRSDGSRVKIYGCSRSAGRGTITSESICIFAEMVSNCGRRLKIYGRKLKTYETKFKIY